MRFAPAIRACLTVMFMLPATAFAQASSPAKIQPETYGTSSKSWYVLSSRDFHPIDSSVTFSIDGNDRSAIFCTGGGCDFDAAIHLPNGALLTEIEYQVCDTNVAADIYANLWTKSRTGTFTILTSLQVTSLALGCQLVTHTYTPPVQIDNNANTYGLELLLSTMDNSNLFIAARIGYKLQVSPAPGTATFNDVPTTHLFFQYIEALAASGITAGCSASPPQYCPDAPLTRGQMAVFLSRALGLHWAP